MSNKLKLNDIKDVVETAYVNTDTVDTDIDDDDIIPYYDDSASEKKQTLWSNIKAKLETYFNDKYLARSHVGMVVHSTTLDTADKVKAVYGGTTWIQLSGYVLRGATGSVTANRNANDGGADSVTVSSVASHNHSQNSHNHSQNSHNHSQNAHDHNFAETSNQYAPAGSKMRWDVQAGSNLVPTHGTTAANRRVLGTTATNIATTATNVAATASNNANGANYTVNTLPKYKNVYIWERTA